jgi:hypothetical protein
LSTTAVTVACFVWLGVASFVDGKVEWCGRVSARGEKWSKEEETGN